MPTVQPSLGFFVWNPISMCSSKLWIIVLFFCRLYLINSPVVRAENLRFKEEGVRDILKDVFLPWYNAYRFLVQNVQGLQHKVQLRAGGSGNHHGREMTGLCSFRAQGITMAGKFTLGGRSGLWRSSDLYSLVWVRSGCMLYLLLICYLLFVPCFIKL